MDNVIPNNVRFHSFLYSDLLNITFGRANAGFRRTLAPEAGELKRQEATAMHLRA